MSQYATIKAIIDQVVTTNGQQEITGSLLNEVLKAMVDSLGSDYQFGGVVVPSSNVGTPDQNVFYIALQAGTYTSFGNTKVPNGITIFMWDGSWTSKILFAGDGGVFDITAYNSNTKYADLAAALGINGANVPESIRKGGMSVKFVSNSDNKYVQYRYMSSSTAVADFTNVANWQGVDDEPTAGSDNLVKSGGVFNIKKELSYIFNEIPIGLTIDSVYGIVNQIGRSGEVQSPTQIKLSATSEFDSYYFIADRNMQIWFGNVINVNYLALTIGYQFDRIENYSNSSTIFCNEEGCFRYRKHEGNLPTESNKLTVHKGDVIVFSVTAGYGNEVVVYGTYTGYYPNTIMDNHIAAVSKVSKKQPLFRYVGTSGIDSSTERVELFLPSTMGYIEYLFVHTVNNTKNADIWRLSYAYAVDDELTAIEQLVIEGEWEVAIELTGRPDFSGGYAHGDQVMRDIVFLVDGAAVNITEFTNLTPFTQMKIVEASYLYDPNTNSVLSDDENSKIKIAEHGSEHVFDENGISINQSLKWLINATGIIKSAYMAMFPAKKASLNKFYLDKDYYARNIEYNRFQGASRVVMFNSNGGAMSDFSVPEYPSHHLLITDNSGLDYHKQYFVIDTNTESTVGTIWNTETFYKIDYND